MFNKFTYMGNFKTKCDLCGTILDTGIMKISTHFNECPEVLVTVLKDNEALIVKRKDAMYVQSSKGRS